VKQEHKTLYRLIERAMNLLPEKHIWKIQMMKEEKNKRGGEITINHLTYMNEARWDIFTDFWELSEAEKLNAIGHEIGHLLIDGLNTLSGDRWAGKEAIYDCNEKTATHIGMIIARLLTKKQK